jgi:hypothetical protein
VAVTRSCAHGIGERDERRFAVMSVRPFRSVAASYTARETCRPCDPSTSYAAPLPREARLLKILAAPAEKNRLCIDRAAPIITIGAGLVGDLLEGQLQDPLLPFIINNNEAALGRYAV